MLDTNIGHREEEFSAIITESAKMLKPIVGIDNNYEVAFITGSGTAANETIISSIGSKGPVLVISNGEFGERLLDVAKMHNKDVTSLRFDWQEKIDLKALEQMLNTRQFNMVYVTHHETSSGMLNPIKEIAKLAHANGAIIAVDAISSIGAETILAKKWDIDIIVGASGKALSAMPGAGILIIKTTVINSLKTHKTSSHYLDLYKHFLYMRDHKQTPNTPAVHVFVSLHASLKEITAQGLKKYQQTISNRANYVRNELTLMGLNYSDYKKYNSKVITCVSLPEYLSFEILSRHLKKNGIIIYGGKGVLKNKIFQIGHIGALDKRDTPFAINQIQKILNETRPEKIVPEILEQHTEAIHAV